MGVNKLQYSHVPYDLLGRAEHNRKPRKCECNSGVLKYTFASIPMQH